MLLFAAASARLCVETIKEKEVTEDYIPQPPPRGCVLKHEKALIRRRRERQPPPRGCVLKQFRLYELLRLCVRSRLRAAVC